MKGIAGCIITYKPNLNKLQSLINNLKEFNIYTIVIDNTPDTYLDNALINPDKLVLFRKNLGIGVAYNTCARLVNEIGYDFILFLDQDTQLLKNFNPHIAINELEKLHFKDKVAIVSLNKQNSTIISPIPNSNFYLTKYTIGNGMIVRSETVKDIKFREDLFLYSIDIEYCSRIRRQGYLILAYKDTMLQHYSGDGMAKYSRFLTKSIAEILSRITHKPFLLYYPYYSNYVRYYMMLRNNIYLISRSQLELSYSKYLLLLSLSLYDRLGFLKSSKVIFEALYHGILGDLMSDNKKKINKL